VPLFEGKSYARYACKAGLPQFWVYWVRLGEKWIAYLNGIMDN